MHSRLVGKVTPSHWTAFGVSGHGNYNVMHGSYNDVTSGRNGKSTTVDYFPGVSARMFGQYRVENIM